MNVSVASNAALRTIVREASYAWTITYATVVLNAATTAIAKMDLSACMCQTMYTTSRMNAYPLVSVIALCHRFVTSRPLHAFVLMNAAKIAIVAATMD